MPWHATAAACSAHGCKLTHVMLQDFFPGAKSGDRDKLRRAVRRCELVGTTNVPKPGEEGTGSARTAWWWHTGDPELSMAKGLLGK
jgi:hypothetical protein